MRIINEIYFPESYLFISVDETGKVEMEIDLLNGINVNLDFAKLAEFFEQTKLKLGDIKNEQYNNHQERE